MTNPGPSDEDIIGDRLNEGENMRLIYDIDGDDDLQIALECNEVKGSAPIKKLLATLEGENDGANWHWLVELENGKIAHLSGWCDYTGWDCQSAAGNNGEYPSLDVALSELGLPTLDVNSDKKIREEFREKLEKAK